MRTLLLSLLAFVASAAHAQGWYRYQDLPLNTAPREAVANDAGTVYLLTRENRILRRPLGGLWSGISPAAMVSPECISADPSSGHIYVGTARQGLFRSADQGASWQLFWLETSPVTGFHEGYKCFAQSGTSGLFFGGHFGAPRITRFTDNGSNGVVRSIANDPNASPSAIHFAQNGSLYVGTHLGIWTSLDQGESFTQTSLNSGLVYDFTETTEGVLYALHEDLATGNTRLMRSTDGSTWDERITPAEDLVSIHFDTGGQRLWLGTRQGIHAQALNSTAWSDMSQNDGPYQVVQVTDDRNGNLLAFSDPYTAQQFSNDSWSTITNGLVGTADRIAFAPNNSLYAFSHFGSNLVSHVSAGTDLWEYALLESTGVGVHTVMIRSDNNIFASTIRGLHRSTDGGATFSNTALPAPYAALQSGYIDLFYATDDALYVKHTHLSTALFSSTDDGVSWVQVSDISGAGLAARFEKVARSGAGTLFSLQVGPHTGQDPHLFSSTDNGSTWTLVPHNYDDFINSFDQHEFHVSGDRLFLVGPHKVYELNEGAPPTIQDLQIPFLNSNNMLLTFKLNSQGRAIVHAFATGVHVHDGVAWHQLGMPTVVQPGTPVLDAVPLYDDLPFVIVRSNNTQNIAPGIYCYLDGSVGTRGRTSTAITRIFPNPTTTQVTIRSSLPIRGTQLIDASGRVILGQQPIAGDHHTLNLHHCAPGHYLLQVITDAGQERHPLVVE